MASEGRNFLFFAPHVSVLPSLVIFAGGAVSAGDDTTVLNYLNSRYAVY